MNKDPQFYPMCSNLDVIGDGSSPLPTQNGVKFPGAYSFDSDPFLTMNIFDGASLKSNYVSPGPRPLSFAAASDALPDTSSPPPSALPSPSTAASPSAKPSRPASTPSVLPLPSTTTSLSTSPSPSASGQSSTGKKCSIEQKEKRSFAVQRPKKISRVMRNIVGP